MLSINEAAKELTPLLKNNQLITFVGSGISINSGLPDWDGFLREFIEFCDSFANEIDDTDFKMTIQDASKKHNIENYPAQVASVLKDKLKQLDRKTDYNVKLQLERWFIRRFLSAEPNIRHKYIVATNFQQILTSNYDDLLEKACSDLGLNKIANRSYTYTDADKIASILYTKKKSIIHIHGLANRITIDEVVLTIEDYLEMIKRKYSAFTLSMQNLFLNYSTLFLGYGASDPHLEDLINEIQYFLQYSKLRELPKNYLVVHKRRGDEIFKKYKEKLRTELIVVEDLKKDYPTLLEKLYNAAPLKDLSQKKLFPKAQL